MTTVLATLPPAHPGPLTPLRLLTAWTFDPAMIIPLVVAAGLYLWGVHRLRRRGDTWDRSRVWWWLLGLGLVFVGTSSAMGVYDRVLFTVPAVQHMVLQMIAPVPLVLGRPMTLALRTLPPRPRAALLSVVHSTTARFIAHPVVAFVFFGVTQFVFYYSSLYDASLRNVWVHDLSHVHFVLVGFLFYWSLLGVDPVPHRPPFFFRFILVVGLAPIHILLGIPIMMMSTLIAGQFYTELGRTWGPSLLQDQYIGGGVLWAFGDLSAAVLIAAFLRQWYRSDEREACRMDRRLDQFQGDQPTMTPWWLLDPDDPDDPDDRDAEVLGPQRDSERAPGRAGPRSSCHEPPHT